MTLIIGFRYSDCVGIAGDTRVSRRDPETRSFTPAADDYQKVYELPPFLVGISGNVDASKYLLAAYLVHSVRSGISDSLAEQEKISRSPQYIADFFGAAYNRYVSIAQSSPTVGLMIATAARTSTPADLRERRFPTGSFSMRAMAQYFAQGPVNVESFVIALHLPEKRAFSANVGDVMFMGSGRLADQHIGDDEFIFAGEVPSEFPPRAEILIKGFTEAKAKDPDPTYNGLVHGMAVGHRQRIALSHVADISRSRDRSPLLTTKPWGSVGAGDIREDVEFLQSQHPDQHFMELFLDNEGWPHWWMVDYRRRQKVPLVDLLREEMEHGSRQTDQASELIV